MEIDVSIDAHIREVERLSLFDQLCGCGIDNNR